MKRDDPCQIGCGAQPASDRCAATLPDNPQCATHFHFGLLLGVDEFRTEQGFHTGHARRHQRLLHGAGVVAGYGVSFDAQRFELRVAPGFAVDAWGRDLALDAAQCVSLPKWWLKHRSDDSFADIATPEDALLDLELVLCYDTCLDRPVPAIADPCAGDTADVAYARICEAVTLQLRRTAPPSPAAPMPSYRLLRVWLGLAPALAADQWLLDAYAATLVLPAPQQAAARASLLRSVLAHAVAAESHLAPAADAEERNLCLPLARLADVRITHAAKGWTAAVPHLDIGVRPVLLPSGLLQALLLAEPGPAAVGAGPVLQPGLAGLTGSTVNLVFNQALEASTVTPAAFSVTEFLAGTGWQTFTATASYDAAAAAGPTVSLLLDPAPAATSQLRLTVIGSGPTPLLGANLIPAGAPHPGADGRTLSTDIARV